MVYCNRKFNGAVKRDHKIIKSRKMKNVSPYAFLFDVSSICWEHILKITDDVNYSVCEWTSPITCPFNPNSCVRNMRPLDRCGAKDNNAEHG